VIHYRQSVYKVMLWNWVPMAEMVKGKRPFEAADSSTARSAWPPPRVTSTRPTPKAPARAPSTDALPAIWENRKDFDGKLEDMQREAQALAQTAASGDEAKIKEQFDKTGGSCKACHDKYRAD
jgi:cytochrome c556